MAREEMKGQADDLRARGVTSVAVNSTPTAAERREAERAIAAGRKEFVYATPEQLADPEFRAGAGATVGGAV